MMDEVSQKEIMSQEINSVSPKCGIFGKCLEIYFQRYVEAYKWAYELKVYIIQSKDFEALSGRS